MMKQAIRALGWGIYALWLIVMMFTVTTVYSAFQLGIAFGEPTTTTSGATMTLLLPFSVENKGFYDISDLNITTIVQEINGALVSNSSTFIPLISNGNKVDATHKISITLDKMTSTSLSRLLFYDTNFDTTLSLALSYARVIPLKISQSIKNFTWGAPLYGLAIGDVTVNDYNITYVKADLRLSFENHSFFNLNGTVRTEIVNTLNKQVGATTTRLRAEPQDVYSTPLAVYVLKGSGGFKEVHLYFDFPSAFSYGPKVMPIG